MVRAHLTSHRSCTEKKRSTAMRFSLIASLLVVLTSIQAARADGLIYQLPADGTQVRYDNEVTFNNNGQERTSTNSLTLSSVGVTTVDSEKCRWIEIKNVTKTDSGERITIAKFLIPEKDLGKDKSPGDHLIRGWIKRGDNEPQPITDLKGPQTRLLVAYLAGPPQNSRDLDKTEIDGKLGKLSCRGVAGDYEFVVDNGSLSVAMENRLNEKAPFGVVSAVWKFERKQNGQVMGSGTSKLTLADINATALSELPDRN
jgi:hypothetical protein